LKWWNTRYRDNWRRRRMMMHLSLLVSWRVQDLAMQIEPKSCRRFRYQRHLQEQQY